MKPWTEISGDAKICSKSETAGHGLVRVVSQVEKKLFKCPLFVTAWNSGDQTLFQ